MYEELAEELVVYDPLDAPLIDESGQVISITKEELVAQVIGLQPIAGGCLHPPI